MQHFEDGDGEYEDHSEASEGEFVSEMQKTLEQKKENDNSSYNNKEARIDTNQTSQTRQPLEVNEQEFEGNEARNMSFSLFISISTTTYDFTEIL